MCVVVNTFTRLLLPCPVINSTAHFLIPNDNELSQRRQLVLISGAGRTVIRRREYWTNSSTMIRYVGYLRRSVVNMIVSFVVKTANALRRIANQSRPYDIVPNYLCRCPFLSVSFSFASFLSSKKATRKDHTEKRV